MRERIVAVLLLTDRSYDPVEEVGRVKVELVIRLATEHAADESDVGIGVVLVAGSPSRYGPAYRLDAVAVLIRDQLFAQSPDTIGHRVEHDEAAVLAHRPVPRRIAGADVAGIAVA